MVLVGWEADFGTDQSSLFEGGLKLFARVILKQFAYNLFEYEYQTSLLPNRSNAK